MNRHRPGTRSLPACALALALLAITAHAAERKPNILLIYTDDHGWADLGAQGVDKDIRTPSMDQLARDGVRFARGYVSAPQCVPSRAGVMTGRYQQKFGVEDNLKGPLPLEEVTIAERLKTAGYATGMVGKWHLDIGGAKGAKKELRVLIDHMPHAQGFDEYWRGELRQFYASHDLAGKPFADAPHLVSDNRFRVVVQTEAALGFFDRRAAKPEQPWFLYLAWFAPHVPLESPEPWFSKTPEHLPLQRRQALAMIAAMDDGLGRIREKLRAMGAEKDTLIFFISDNGAPLTRGAWNGSLNLPLIGEKGMLTDGGIRTPFVAAWPGTLPAGRTYEHPVINLDVAATAVALAGLPHDDRLDGVNLIPFITGQNNAAPHDALFWRWRSQSAVLEFPWKLIHLADTEQFLFDVTTPEGERKNLFSEHPDIVARLDAKLKKWSATLKPPGPPEPLNEQDARFYAEHVDEHLAKLVPLRAQDRAEAPGSIHGWLCRNGTIAVKNGALAITPDANAGKNARCFITHAALDIAGPVTATLRMRAQQGGKGSTTWRTKAENDFVAENTAAFDWPASAEWQELKIELPVKGRLLHLRIMPAKECAGLEVQSLTLAPASGSPAVFDFTKTSDAR